MSIAFDGNYLQLCDAKRSIKMSECVVNIKRLYYTFFSLHNTDDDYTSYLTFFLKLTPNSNFNSISNL